MKRKRFFSLLISYFFLLLLYDYTCLFHCVVFSYSQSSIIFHLSGKRLDLQKMCKKKISRTIEARILCYTAHILFLNRYLHTSQSQAVCNVQHGRIDGGALTNNNNNNNISESHSILLPLLVAKKCFVKILCPTDVYLAAHSFFERLVGSRRRQCRGDNDKTQCGDNTHAIKTKTHLALEPDRLGRLM